MTDGIPSPSVRRPPALTKPWSDWYNYRTLLAMCAVLIIVGSFGPWITTGTTDPHFSRSGMDFDGLLTLVGGALLVLFVFLRRYIGAIVIGAVVTICGVLNHRDLEGDTLFHDGKSITGSIGWGLYAVLAGGIGALIFGNLCLRHDRKKVTT